MELLDRFFATRPAAIARAAKQAREKLAGERKEAAAKLAEVRKKIASTAPSAAQRIQTATETIRKLEADNKAAIDKQLGIIQAANGEVVGLEAQESNLLCKLRATSSELIADFKRHLMLEEENTRARFDHHHTRETGGWDGDQIFYFSNKSAIEARIKAIRAATAAAEELVLEPVTDEDIVAARLEAISSAIPSMDTLLVKQQLHK